MDIADRRREYTRETLDEGAAACNPFDQFRSWFDAALASELREPTAVALATVGADARPVGAHGAAEGLRRARVRLLHQL